MNLTFLHPHYFFLLLLLIPMIGWYVWRLKTMNASLQLSSLKGFSAIGKSRKIYIRHLPLYFEGAGRGVFDSGPGKAPNHQQIANLHHRRH
jgi:hypothetical protein